VLTRSCHYLDECHTRIGGNDYHICEFAERMESIGARYEPAEQQNKEQEHARPAAAPAQQKENVQVGALTAAGLPEYCFGKLEADGEIVRIARGESGYYRIAPQPTLPLIELNASIGVSKAQAEAMMVGSMFGWDKPGADPKRYDPDGRPAPTGKRRNSQIER
jgi:hypothetical protein